MKVERNRPFRPLGRPIVVEIHGVAVGKRRSSTIREEAS
jgi:hypothetical protein